MINNRGSRGVSLVVGVLLCNFKGQNLNLICRDGCNLVISVIIINKFYPFPLWKKKLIKEKLMNIFTILIYLEIIVKMPIHDQNSFFFWENDQNSWLVN